MKNRIAIVMTCALVGCSSKTEHPPHAMVEQAYFVCEPSRNLEGGIFGKGPTKRFGPQVSACKSDEWKKIGKREFRKKASEWYDMNWMKEIPFWNGSGKGNNPKGKAIIGSIACQESEPIQAIQVAINQMKYSMLFVAESIYVDTTYGNCGILLRNGKKTIPPLDAMDFGIDRTDTISILLAD